MRKGALPHPCIIVNGNRRTEENGVGLGTRLGISCPAAFAVFRDKSFVTVVAVLFQEMCNNCAVCAAFPMTVVAILFQEMSTTHCNSRDIIHDCCGILYPGRISCRRVAAR